MVQDHLWIILLKHIQFLILEMIINHLFEFFYHQNE